VGSLVGVALLTLLPEIFQPFALYKRLAEGVLLVLAFQYLPAGIYGTLAAALSRLASRRDAPQPLDLALSRDETR
jgi:branched-chain amino acid transport system permease protein